MNDLFTNFDINWFKNNQIALMIMSADILSMDIHMKSDIFIIMNNRIHSTSLPLVPLVWTNHQIKTIPTKMASLS